MTIYGRFPFTLGGKSLHHLCTIFVHPCASLYLFALIFAHRGVHPCTPLHSSLCIFAGVRVAPTPLLVIAFSTGANELALAPAVVAGMGRRIEVGTKMLQRWYKDGLPRYKDCTKMACRCTNIVQRCAKITAKEMALGEREPSINSHVTPRRRARSLRT